MDAVISKTRAVARGVKAALDGYVGVWRTLVEDHARVASLIEAVQRDPTKRAGLWPRIRAELLAHERAELRDVYPVLRNYDATKHWAEQHEIEARELEERIDRLDATPVEEDVWGELFDELARTISVHVREEETEIFPLASSAIGPTRSKSIGDSYDATRKRFAASV